MCAPTRLMSIPGILLIVLMGTAVAGGPLSPATAFAQEARTYTVRQGDTLYSISRRYDVSIEQIRRLNGLRDNTISIGQVLRLTPADPVDEGNAADAGSRDASDAGVDITGENAGAPAGAVFADSTAPGFVISSDGRIGRVLVRGGTQLMDIAIRFAVHPDSLLSLNSELDDPLASDTEVRVPADRLVRVVTVRRGDTLYNIGRTYAVTVDALREVNGLTSDNLAVGSGLRVPVRAVDLDDIRPAAPVDDIIPAAAYPGSHAGRRLLDGRTYDPQDFVVSHPYIRIGSTVLITVPENGVSAFAVVADRTAGGSADLMDISAAVAEQLNMSRSGTRLLEVRIVD